MTHGPEHHMEEAEHFKHSAHDPFDKRVAMTIAIVAAVLACVTMLSHRAHNQTLQLQLKATDEFTKASNTWNQFQAQKNRQYLYETQTLLARVATRNRGATGAQEPALSPAEKEQAAKDQTKLQKMEDDIDRYRKQTDKLKEKAEGLQEEAARLRGESKHMHHVGDQYDLAELAVEFGLVLCSVAVLTKFRGFWYTGIGCGLLGMVIGMTTWFGLLLSHD